MGTRHLTCVVLDGRFKIAQYGQWDGYPEGQGATIVDFLRTTDLEKFKTQLRKTQFLSEEEANRSSLHHEPIPAQFDRDTGAGILKWVLDAETEVIELYSSLDFAADSLFCEFAYVVDLDANTLEFYRGFNKTPVDPKERFASLPHLKEHRTEQYYPVRLALTLTFPELAENPVGRMIAAKDALDNAEEDDADEEE